MEQSGLVFLPGLLCDRQLWSQQVDALKSTVRCQVADLTQDSSISAMAERVIATAPKRFVLVALSMGGYVAFELLRRFPERISAVALFDTTAAPDSPEKADERRAGIESLAAGRFLGVTRRLLPQLVHEKHVGGPVGQAVRSMAERVGGDAYLQQQTAILGRIDSRPWLNLIAVPTLVGVGAQDALTPPSEARALRQAIAGSRLHVFSECGHLPPLENSDETTDVLQTWLAGSVFV